MRERGLKGVDVDVRIGWFTRLERIVVILLILIVPQTIEIGLWVLAIGTNITAMQRIWFVHKTLRERHLRGRLNGLSTRVYRNRIGSDPLLWHHHRYRHVGCDDGCCQYRQTHQA